jgi:hypothetical protein
MQTKFNYTNGDEFLLNGVPYTGYYNVNDSGDTYTEKYYNAKSNVLLNALSEYSADYCRSEYFKDRFPLDTISLPHNLEEILISPNELVNFNTLNSKLLLLNKNIIYLYSKMFMGSTQIPVGFDVTLSNYKKLDDSYSFEWSNDRGLISPVSYNPLYTQFSEFDKIKKFVIVPFFDNSGIGMIGISDTYVVGLTSAYTSTGSLSNPEFVLYTNYIDNDSLETFKKLEDITYDGNHLFISDSKINGGGQVFKYDINSFYSKNPIFNYKKYLMEPIGGVGGLDRDNKFNGCSILGSKDGEVWIYDSGNGVVKIYDSNFIFKKIIRISNVIDYKILDIRYRKIDDCMYLLYEYLDENTGNLRFGYFIYNNYNTLIKTVLFNDVLQTDSDVRFNRMAMSEQDSNIFYLTTNVTVYKKFFSRPEDTIAVFFRDSFTNQDSFTFDRVDINFDDTTYTFNYNEYYNFDMAVSDIYIVGNDTKDYDDMFLFGNGFISHFKEKTEYDMMLRNKNLLYYNMEKLKFEKNEYAQSFVFNKEFFKLYFNVLQLKNNLLGKFLFEFDKYGNLKNRDIVYLTDDEINSIGVDIEYDSFVNDNEFLNPNVINRLIKDIYNLQLNILSITIAKILNLKTAITRDGSNIITIA